MRFSRFQLMTLDNGHVFDRLLQAAGQIRLQSKLQGKESRHAVLFDDVRGVPKPSSNISS